MMQWSEFYPWLLMGANEGLKRRALSPAGPSHKKDQREAREIGKEEWESTCAPTTRERS